MIAHSFLIEDSFCDDHQTFEPHLVVNEVDTKNHRNFKTAKYPLHHGGAQQLFLNLANYVGNRIPTNPESNR